MNDPYLLIPLFILSLGLYLYSRLMAKYGIISRTFHRRIWNVILLVVFMTTAVLGILLVIQINYKLEWPIVKSLLKWHVNFGIALSLVAVFHFLWHLKYYINIIKSRQGSQFRNNTLINITPADNNNFTVFILLSGFIATVVQVLMIREITTVFQGNELMMAWTLGIWMLGTGSGSFSGRLVKIPGHPVHFLKQILFWIAFIPVVMVIIMNLLRNIVSPPGTVVNPAYFIIIIFLVLSPVCILSGLVFSLLVKITSNKMDEFIMVYAFEAIGSLAGGIIVSLVLINWFSILQSLLIVVFIVPLIFFLRTKQKPDLLYALAALIPLAVSLIYPVDNYLKSFLFTNQKIEESKETFYGNITVTENAGQYSFFENGSLLFTSDNLISSEENVHYAMLQRESPERVLLIGGGISGMLGELLKYKTVTQIDYVELNPRLINISKRYVNLPADNRINIIYTDGRKYLSETRQKYDIAIFALPDPSSLMVNRYYTDEFFSLLKSRLTNNAVVLFSHSPAGNYVSPEMAAMEGCVYHTLSGNFRYVEIVPGDRDYFVASDAQVSNGIVALSLHRSINNQYVNPYYLDDLLIRRRSNDIKMNISNSTEINSDRRPVPVFLHSLHFLTEFGHPAGLFLITPVVILLLPLFFMKPVTVGIYIAGFTASSIELLLIFLFQAAHGYIYSAIGMIIAIFMGGLAAGSFFCYSRPVNKNQLVSGQFLLAIYAILFPLFAYLEFHNLNNSVKILLFIIATFTISSIVGFQFAAGTRLKSGIISFNAAALYAADLIGSSLGVITITILLLPLLGLQNCSFLVAGLNLIAVLTMIFRKT